jgi:hypothetical protein
MTRYCIVSGDSPFDGRLKETGLAYLFSSQVALTSLAEH